ncbi:hypothetical protein [Seonamhaeicola sp.]|uniref:hypothetical protein n=1 Tax=Seonamhaeicola sp. TaxID=1912245 RepID=UPI00261937CC|nr:hypothetical protein [Seonamhaeicola sp.]
MGLELVIFITAILFGIFIYWRESQHNRLYRFFNKLFNSKELQMKPEDKKGFVYKQAFLPRLVYVVGLFLVAGLVIQFLSPFEIFTSYNGISAFSSITVGTLIGTYLANFVLKSGKVIEEKSDSLGDMVQDTIEKGKHIIEDIKTKDAEEVTEEEIKEETTKKEGKSARERLKDKGYLK